MSFDPTRLRRGEWLAGVGGAVLIAALFLVDWYGADVNVGGGVTLSFSADGWHSHSILRWLMLLAGLAGIVLWVVTAVSDTDAVPLSVAVAAALLGLLTVVPLAWRVLVDEPGDNAYVAVKAGAWIGLLATLAVLVGAWLSMRDEDRGAPLPPIRLRRLS